MPEPYQKPSPRVPSPGWRAFSCDGCGRFMVRPSRVHRSASAETCPGCGLDIRSSSSWADSSLPVDDLGNLTCPHDMTPEQHHKIKTNGRR